MFGFGKKKEVENKTQLENKKTTKKPIAKDNKVKKPIIKKKEEKKEKNFDPNHVSALELYDDMLSNIKAQKLMIPSSAVLNNEQLSLEWGRVVTKTSIIKMFIVEKYQSWVDKNLLQYLKEMTLNGVYDVQFNYFMDIAPHTIDWDSPKMVQLNRQWQRRIENDDVDRTNTFTQRSTAGETAKLKNMEQTIKYFTDADITYRRSIFKTSLFIQIIGNRNNLDALDQAVTNFKAGCRSCGIQATELSGEVFDYMRYELPTSMKWVNGIDRKIPIQIMSDDTITMLQSNNQGKIGDKGVPMGLDVYSGLPVFHVFREDKDNAENVLVTAGTGGGKSVFTKNCILWCLREGMSVCVLDYEGDEYTNLAKFLNSGKEGEAVVINMKAGNGRYFDPLRISDVTGSKELDEDGKTASLDFTKAMMKILLGGQISLEEDSILSQIIARIYAEAGVTDNPSTWHKSKDLNITMVYDVLCRLIEQREWINKRGDDSLQKAAETMKLKLMKYFVKGESEYGTFKEILNIEDIRNARFIVFSFGNKGADQQGANQVKLALKQLCVSKVTNEISNYNKYVKKSNFTLKIWEEVQRFVDIPGAEDIMTNCVTGGRKRGDIAFIITNNLSQLLDGSSNFMKALKTNLTGFCIGYIKDAGTRERVCETFDLQLFKKDLDKIAYENSISARDSSGNTIDSPFRKAFLIKLDASTKSPAVQTIVKAAVDQALFDKNIFNPGELDEDIT